MESEDKRINQLPQISSAPTNGVLPIDVHGSDVTNGITVDNLFQGYFGIKSVFEGDADNLRTNGVYYANGRTQNTYSVGILLVFTVDISVLQFSVDIFNGFFAYRSLLYNDGKLDKWTEWRLISFT